MNENIGRYLKGIIYHELCGFMLCEDKIPNEIVITVDYPQTRARLCIDPLDIAERMPVASMQWVREEVEF